MVRIKYGSSHVSNHMALSQLRYWQSSFPLHFLLCRLSFTLCSSVPLWTHIHCHSRHPHPLQANTDTFECYSTFIAFAIQKPGLYLKLNWILPRYGNIINKPMDVIMTRLVLANVLFTFTSQYTPFCHISNYHPTCYLSSNPIARQETILQKSVLC